MADKERYTDIEFLPNCSTEWYGITESQQGTYGGHNPECAVDSQCCSIEMSTEVPEDRAKLCLWHHARMNNHVVEYCGCRRNHVCVGDATGRRMFRNYHNTPDIPVIDAGCRFYCCGGCQNRDDYVARCGDMFVCEEHKHLHDYDTLEPASFDDDSDY